MTGQAIAVGKVSTCPARTQVAKPSDQTPGCTSGNEKVLRQVSVGIEPNLVQVKAEIVRCLQSMKQRVEGFSLAYARFPIQHA